MEGDGKMVEGGEYGLLAVSHCEMCSTEDGLELAAASRSSREPALALAQAAGDCCEDGPDDECECDAAPQGPRGAGRGLP